VIGQNIKRAFLVSGRNGKDFIFNNHPSGIDDFKIKQTSRFRVKAKHDELGLSKIITIKMATT
jgi:hypothetical protein